MYNVSIMSILNLSTRFSHLTPSVASSGIIQLLRQTPDLNRLYIGQTTNPETRIKQHISKFQIPYMTILYTTKCMCNAGQMEHLLIKQAMREFGPVMLNKSDSSRGLVYGKPWYHVYLCHDITL